MLNTVVDVVVLVIVEPEAPEASPEPLVAVPVTMLWMGTHVPALTSNAYPEKH